MDNLKKLILENLTENDIKINTRYTKILSKTCFWSKKNFSAIIKHHGVKFYCTFNNVLNDITIEKMN